MIVGDFGEKVKAPSKTLCITPKVQKEFRGLGYRKPMGVVPPLCLMERSVGMPYTQFMYQDCLENQVASAMSRYGCAMPQHRPDDGLLVEYGRCLIRLIPNLTNDDLVSFEDWVSKYPGPRQEYLRKLRAENSIFDAAKQVKSEKFTKWEFYPEPKVPRTINSPGDLAKCYLGPLQESIDKKMFASYPNTFVKGTDPTTWPDKLEKLFGDSRVVNTDFTSFECHHRGPYAKLIWFWQMHMLRNVHVSRAHKDAISKLIQGTNHMSSKYDRCSVAQTLMSGVAWTSSSNALLNWIINSFLAMRHRYPTLSMNELAVKTTTEFRAVFEGDDGLFEDVGVSDDEIRRLSIKLDYQRKCDYTLAAFCSQVIDRKERVLCYDWKKALAKLSCLPIKYKHASDTHTDAHLRCMALSYKYLYGNSPVVGPLVHKLLEITRGTDIRRVQRCALDAHAKFILDLALEHGMNKRQPAPIIGEGTRLVYQSHFGLTPDEQVRMEDAISQLSRSNMNLDFAEHLKPLELDIMVRFNSRDEVYLRPNVPTTRIYKDLSRDGDDDTVELDFSVADVVKHGLKARLRCTMAAKADRPSAPAACVTLR